MYRVALTAILWVMLCLLQHKSLMLHVLLIQKVGKKMKLLSKKVKLEL